MTRIVLPALLLLGVQAVPAPAAPEADDVQGVVYLGSERPVLLRLHVRIDGKPYTVAWADFLRKLFDYADVNRDDTLSSEEAARVPSVQLMRTQFRGIIGGIGDRGNSPPFTELDANKDGKVSLEELQGYFRRNNFGPMQSAAASGQGRSGSLTDVLFKHLDVGGDGKLSKEELAQAGKMLHRLDTDENEIIAASELVPDPDPYGGFIAFDPSGMAERPATSEFFQLLIPGEPPERMTKVLLDRYDKDKSGKLSPVECGLDEATFRRLDGDRDGQLSTAELAGWLAGPSDLELTVPLGQQAARKPPGGLLKVIVEAGGSRNAPTVEVQPSPGKDWPLSGRLRREGGGLVLTQGVARIDFRGGNPVVFRLGVTRSFYLQQFRMMLKDKKDYLEKAEAESAQFLRWLFVFADRDGDGKLYEKELNAFLDMLDQGSSAFTTLQIADHGAGLFELLDADRDGRLGVRELRTGWERVAPWDRSKAGAVSREEVPRQFQVTINQGLANDGRFGNVVVARAGMGAPPPPSRGPVWFRKMDRNADGDVSRREWLGSAEDFRKVDTDGDGLISLEEADKADRAMRKDGK